MVFKELFEQGASQQVLKDLPLPMLIALAFGPLLGWPGITSWICSPG